MTWQRKIFILLVLAAVAGAVVYGYMPGPVPVDVVKVWRGEMRVTIDEEGKTRVVDRYVVSAPVAGFARRVEFDVGSTVARGARLLELEPQRSMVLDPRSRAEARARVSAAKAALGAARENETAAGADSVYAKATLARTRKLFEDGYVTKDRLDQAKAESGRRDANLRSARFAVDVATHEHEAARTALRYQGVGDGGDNGELVTIVAPVDGTVLKVHHRSEGVVSVGTPLIEIGDPGALEVETDILSSDAVKIVQGGRVLFKRWGGDAPLEGRVRVVEPTGFTRVSALGVEEQRVLVISEITSPAELWARLGDGYRVETSFILWEGTDVLQAPASALFRSGKAGGTGGGWAVFVVKDGRAELRSVRIGHVNGLAAEITGLEEGTEVITHPADALEDGTNIRLR